MAEPDTINLTADFIQAEDVIKRLTWVETEHARLEAENADDPDYENEFEDELLTLRSIDEQGRSNFVGEWPTMTLIDEDHFEDYARKLAVDIGGISDEHAWPSNHIDWKAAAEALLIDYAEVEVEPGSIYYGRA